MPSVKAHEELELVEIKLSRAEEAPAAVEGRARAGEGGGVFGDQIVFDHRSHLLSTALKPRTASVSCEVVFSLASLRVLECGISQQSVLHIAAIYHYGFAKLMLRRYDLTLPWYRYRQVGSCMHLAERKIL